jgi:hypothetical protein
MRRDSLERSADLMVAIPDQMELSNGALSMLVHVANKRCREPREDEPEKGLDRKPVGSAIVIGKKQPVNGFAHSEGGEYDGDAHKENWHHFEGLTDRGMVLKARPH